MGSPMKVGAFDLFLLGVLFGHVDNMKPLNILTGIGTFGLLGILFLFRQPAALFSSASTMINSQTAICNHAPIKTSLRIWLDPIPRSPAGSGALPPGIDPPPAQVQGPETHALNLELGLVNTSEDQQSVSVLGWRWQQGSQTQAIAWNVQPNMSPLNQYTHVQRHLVELEGTEPVSVTMDLSVNGQRCRLMAEQPT